MRTIPKLVAMAILGVALQACGGGSDSAGASGALTPEAACSEMAPEICGKFYECFSPDVLASDSETFGTSREDCIQKAQAKCTPAMVACEPGTTYDATNAQSCLDDFKSVSCGDLTANKLPAACNGICK